MKKLDTLAKDLEQAISRILKEPSFAVNAAKVSHLMKAHRETRLNLLQVSDPLLLFVSLKQLIVRSLYLLQGLVTLLAQALHAHCNMPDSVTKY